jgi:predicted MFS family arabinose efflux permease
MVIAEILSTYSKFDRKVWPLIFATLINRMGSMVLFFLALYLTKELGFSLASTGIISSFFGLGCVAGSYLGGEFTHHLGARNTQLLSLFFSAFFFILIPQVTTQGLFTLLIFFSGVAIDLLRPANSAALAKLARKDNISTLITLDRQAVSIGCAFGPMLGGFIAQYNFGAIFYLDALTSFLAFAIILFFTRDDEVVGSEAGTSDHQMKHPLRNGIFLQYLIVVFAMGLVFFQMFTAFPLYLSKHFGYSQANIGLLMGFNSALIFVFEMILNNKLKKYSPYLIVAAGILSMGIGTYILEISRHSLIPWVSIVIWTIGEMTFLPFMIAIVIKLSAGMSKGRCLGLYNCAFSAAMLIAPNLGVFLLEQTYRITIWQFSLLLAGGVALILLQMNYRLNRGSPFES